MLTRETRWLGNSWIIPLTSGPLTKFHWSATKIIWWIWTEFLLEFLKDADHRNLMALEFFKNSAALCFSGQISLVCYKNYLINPDRILIFKECRPENLDGFGILQEFCFPLVLWPNYIYKYERKGYLRPQFHFGVCYIWYFSTFLVRILLEKQTATEFFKIFRWNSDRKELHTWANSRHSK